MRSRAGMATVSSWMTIEEVIYGVMDSAKMVALANAPPERMSR